MQMARFKLTQKCVYVHVPVYITDLMMVMIGNKIEIESFSFFRCHWTIPIKWVRLKFFFSFRNFLLNFLISNYLHEYVFVNPPLLQTIIIYICVQKYPRGVICRAHYHVTFSEWCYARSSTTKNLLMDP